MLNQSYLSVTLAVIKFGNNHNRSKIMKKMFALIVLVSPLISFAQSDAVVGVYSKEAGNEKHRIEYKLMLNEDGTFTFHSHTNIKAGIPQIVNKYGRGSWSNEDNVVSLLTDEEKDIDEKYTLNFSGSRARFITKSPRDKTNRVIQTRLQFFESRIFWIERLEIPKIIKTLNH